MLSIGQISLGRKIAQLENGGLTFRDGQVGQRLPPIHRYHPSVIPPPTAKSDHTLSAENPLGLVIHPPDIHDQPLLPNFPRHGS